MSRLDAPADDEDTRGHRWTGEMAQLADICGEDAAEALFAVARKCPVYVPLGLAEAAETCPLRKLSPEIAERIVAAMGGSTIYVSLPDDGRAQRWAEARRMYMAGVPAQQIALALQLSERQVYRILKGRAVRGRLVDERQLDIFLDQKE